MSAAALRVAGVHKRYGEQVVLDGVDLMIEAGESVALVGANGAGKTTLLRCIVDLVRPDAGEVLVSGRPVMREPRARMRIGWALGDEHAWYTRLDGRTNLQIFARMRGMSRQEAAAESDARLAEVSLTAAARSRVATYSTGMRARLAIARARLGDPQVIVLDEVGRGLDEDGQALLAEWLQRPHTAAIVVVTHARNIAGAASRRAVLRAGRIV
jgi:ABC-type multidrug transport system ATPase subunit